MSDSMHVQVLKSQLDRCQQERDDARELLSRIVQQLEQWRQRGGLINLDSLAESLDEASQQPWLTAEEESDE